MTKGILSDYYIACVIICVQRIQRRITPLYEDISMIPAIYNKKCAIWVTIFYPKKEEPFKYFNLNSLGIVKNLKIVWWHFVTNIRFLLPGCFITWQIFYFIAYFIGIIWRSVDCNNFYARIPRIRFWINCRSKIILKVKTLRVVGIISYHHCMPAYNNWITRYYI